MFPRREMGSKEMEKRSTTSASTHVDGKTRQVQANKKKTMFTHNQRQHQQQQYECTGSKKKKSTEGYKADSLASTAKIGCSPVRDRIRNGKKKKRERQCETSG